MRLSARTHPSEHAVNKFVNPVVRVFLISLCIGRRGFSQASTSPLSDSVAQAPTFDISTVKPSKDPSGGVFMRSPADGFIASGISLRQLIQVSYRLYNRDFVIGGPPWIDADKFDFEAKVDNSRPGATKVALRDRQRTALLQPVLADRFQLKLHEIKKDFPIYNLVLAKGGPKVRASVSPSGTECGINAGAPGVNVVVSCTLKEFAENMGYPTGRTVVDKTGLTGRYDFELHWTPDNTPANSPNADGPSIFTAFQEQLGLKLEPGTAALTVLSIDSAEKPTPN